jgi:hypothetical protein
MSVKNRNSVVTDGLVFYVDAGNANSYPGTGTTWSDLSEGIDGTLYNTPTFGTANGGNFDFNGTNEYYETGQSIISGLSAFTLEVWVKLDQTSFPMNVMYHEWHIGDNAVLFRVQSNVIQFYVRKSDDSGNIGGNFNSFTDTTNWNHIVGTWDGTTLKVHVNGTAMSTTHTGTGAVHTTTTNNAFIGYYGNPASYFLNGKISKLAIYNKALTTDEITQNYNALKNRFI